MIQQIALGLGLCINLLVVMLCTWMIGRFIKECFAGIKLTLIVLLVFGSYAFMMYACYYSTLSLWRGITDAPI